MALITKAQLTGVVQTRSGYKSTNTILTEARGSFRSQTRTSVFLSHAHADRIYIEQAVGFFRTLDIAVYVDWLDNTMPASPNGETGRRIKSKIAENDKFVFLATDLAVGSKWCNWEVGIGDAFKLPSDKICLLPLAENSGHWSGSEYLQLYPRIEATSGGSSLSPEALRVRYPNGADISLTQWLTK